MLAQFGPVCRALWDLPIFHNGCAAEGCAGQHAVECIIHAFVLSFSRAGAAKVGTVTGTWLFSREPNVTIAGSGTRIEGNLIRPRVPPLFPNREARKTECCLDEDNFNNAGEAR